MRLKDVQKEVIAFVYMMMSKSYNMNSIVFVTLVFCLFSCGTASSSDDKDADSKESVIPFDDERPHHWPEPFQRVEITSTLDSTQQSAWYYGTTETKPMPLLVFLHSWSGDYQQRDTLAIMAVKENWNYIHPDFRGPNKTIKACCSDYALEDIDQSIDYVMQNSRVDHSRIFVIGSSGGGYAALATYMKSRHPIHTISAWVPISDLEAWYHESVIRKNKYADDILKCTGSETGNLNIAEAHKRSPIFWETPERSTLLNIYTGVNDGIEGSVPITQSINFYNKIVKDLGATDPKHLVDDKNVRYLLEHRKPLGDFGELQGRSVCLKKNYKNISLVVFDGGHEMLETTAFNSVYKIR